MPNDEESGLTNASDADVIDHLNALADEAKLEKQPNEDEDTEAGNLMVDTSENAVLQKDAIADVKFRNRPAEPINMEIGDTDFMLPYWEGKSNQNYSTDKDLMLALPLDHEMGYQRNPGHPQLINAIRELHGKVGNCKTEGKYIVVAHGIRQALGAAMFAYGSKHDLNQVYADPPNFFLFQDMAWMQGFEFSNEPGGLEPAKMINIITTPSNPLNQKGQGERGDFNIFDECYNWPQYDDVTLWPDNQEVEIFGLAKATGHAGTRIGWAVVPDKEIADLMQEYIRLSTGGVSVDAQARAINIISSQLKLFAAGKKANTVFSWSRKVLDERWNQLHHMGLMSKGHLSGIEIVNMSGMFAWCKLHNEEVEKLFNPKGAVEVIKDEYNIVGMPGDKCYPGAHDMFRLNIGCSQEVFNRFLDVMRPLSNETQCDSGVKVEE